MSKGICMPSFARLASLLLAMLFLPAAAPVLAQEAPPSVVVFARDPTPAAKGRLVEQLARERGLKLEYVFVDEMGEDAIKAKLAGRDLVLFDWPMDAPLTARAAFNRLIKAVEPTLAGFEGKIWGGLDWRRTELTKDLEPEACERIEAYLQEGGAKNEAALVDYLRTDVLGRPGASGAPPVVMPDYGLYHPDAPDRIFSSLEDYLAWRAPAPDQKVVAVGFYRNALSSDTTLHIDDLVHRLEAKGAFVLPYWGRGSPTKLGELLKIDGKALPDALVTFTYVFAVADEQSAFAARENIPILQALVYSKGYEDEWRKSDEGVNVALGPLYYDLAEKAGRIDATMVAAKRRGDEQLVAIPEQSEAMAERALAQANLRRKPNKDKKLALFLWNSPPGEENFQASFLNVPASIVDIVERLRAEGYDIPVIEERQAIETIKKLIRPYYRTKNDAELRKLLDAGLADRIPVSEYTAFVATLPEATQKALAAGWEKPEETYLTLREGDEFYFVAPRWKLGNLMIQPQPLRGARRSDEADILHDKTRPLHPAYRAVYFDMVHRQQIDAIVHLGTHGTQEFLLGKERAPSVLDDIQSTVGNVPVIYPYAVNDPGEAITAKRRGRAVTVSHDDPPYAPSGLYGELSELHEMINQAQIAMPGLTKDALVRQILALATKLNLTKDAGIADADVAKDPQKTIEKIDGALHGLASLPQPLGLRTFGQTAESDKILLTVLQILGPDYIKAFGRSPSLVTTRPYQELERDEVFLALKRAVLENADLSLFPEKARPFLADARVHYEHFAHTKELDNFVNALAGGFTPTTTGNDPLRNPEAVPTGRNLYGFDPHRIPTKAAWEAGGKLARDFLDKYENQHGVLPDKIAFELWQTETVNHFGVVESKIFSLLGVKPVWNERGEVTGVEVVPREALRRPRVDVVLSIGGLYRDNLPELMLLIQSAVDKVAALKEDDNPVALNVERTLQTLLAKGIEPGRAARLARVRMFGNESGVYGTKLAPATVASGIWDRDDVLAETYLDRMSFAYGVDPDTRNVKIDGLNLYAEALHGTKAALLSRSSNSYGVINTDDPFQYLGGIGLAVRHLDGRTPELYLTDLRDTRNFKTKTLSEFISFELRSRMFHPRYVQELMRERYAGATQMVYDLNNFWGWDVMDPSSVRADQWREFYDVYVQDKYKLGLEKFFKEHHPAALAQIAERMLEAKRKGYWDAPEDVVRRLVEVHREIAATHDLDVRNEKFAAYVKAKAAGYGPTVAVAPPQALASAPPAPATAEQAAPAKAEQVEGVKLEKAPAPEPPAAPQHYEIYALIFGSFGAGAAFEFGRGRFRRSSRV
jgi:cobaltochelatase CobN